MKTSKLFTKTFSTIAALSMFLPSVALAQSLQGTTCIAYGIDLSYDCRVDELKKVTVEQIYQQGWRVVAAVKDGSFAYLIIEKNRNESSQNMEPPKSPKTDR